MNEANGGRLRIDIHCHLIPLDKKSGSIVSDKVRNGYVFRLMKMWYGGRSGGDAAFDAKMESLLAAWIRESEMADRAVALAMDGVYDSRGRLDEAATHAYVPNDYIFEAAKRNEEILIGASVNPARADAIEELERARAAGAVLIKLVPNSQGCDLSDKKYIPYFRKLAELRLPLLSHTGYEHCIPSVDQMYGDPQLLRTALDEGATVIAGHCGCSGHGHPVEFFGRFVKMAEKHKNLYADVSALTSLSRFGYAPKIARETALHDRLLQGTDFPVLPMPFLFAGRLGAADLKRVYNSRNMFDRDARAKLAMGFPEEMLFRASNILPL